MLFFVFVFLNFGMFDQFVSKIHIKIVKFSSETGIQPNANQEI